MRRALSDTAEPLANAATEVNMYTVVQTVITSSDPRVAPFTLWAVTEPRKGSVVFWTRSLEAAAVAAAERNS